MTPIRRLAAVVLSMSSPEGAGLRVEEAVEGGATRSQALTYAALSVAPRVCGRSALWLHGVSPPPQKHWVRVPRKSAGSVRRDGTVFRFGEVSGSLYWLSGLPTVDVEQAFMDIAGAREHRSEIWLHHDLGKAIATAHAKRCTTLEGMQLRIDASGRFVGAPLLRDVVADLRGELAHSATEKRARKIASQILRRYGLELHPEPFLVTAGEEKLGEADLPILAIRLDIEVDGPHHLLPEQQREDRLRDRRMRRADWEVERFSTELIDLSPRQFAAQVEECVQARLRRFSRGIPAPAQEILG